MVEHASAMKRVEHKKGQRRWYITKDVRTGKRQISFWDEPPEGNEDFMWSHPFSSETSARAWGVLNPGKP